ncbi:MAG: polysaccharide biosynthesis/export family protein [Terriglobia bacterium]
MKPALKLFLLVFLGVGLLGATIKPLWAQNQSSPPDDQQQTGSFDQQQTDSPTTSNQETQANQPSQRTLPTNVTNPDYVIGPEDVLTINVFNLPEMEQTVRVENDGTISVRLLGPVKAEGLTSLQLKHALEKDWGKDYLQDPQVSIFVKKFNSRPVSLVGSVEKPGLYQLPGSRNLIQVLAMAGGLVRSSSNGPGAGRYLYITRKKGFDNLEPMDGVELVAPDKLRVDIKNLLYTNEQGPTVQIKPLDLITVPRAGVVYVVGSGVRLPGKIILEDQDSMTVLQALAVAEGLAPYAAKSRAIIRRRTPSGSFTEVPIDVGKVLKGKAEDPSLADNDVLFVPGSVGRIAGAQGISTAIGVLSGWLIWK